MAKTNWQDPKTGEIISPHISGLQEAVGKIEESIGIDTVSETNIPLSEVFISNDDRCRIYQAPIGKRNWLLSPAPIIKKNGVIIINDFEIDYGGGAVIFTTPILETDTLTADATYTVQVEGKQLSTNDYTDEEKQKNQANKENIENLSETVGDTTIDDTIVPTSDTGLSVKVLLSWLGNMIKSITGKTSWRIKPTKNMEELNTALTTHEAEKATTTKLGHVKAGTNVTIDEDGFINVESAGKVESVNGKVGAVELDADDLPQLVANDLKIGRNAKTSNTYSTAISCEARADAYQAIALGYKAEATVDAGAGIALGAHSKSTFTGAVALGSASEANNFGSVAIGMKAISNMMGEGVLGDENNVDEWRVPGSFTVQGTKNFEMPHPKPEKKATHRIRHGAVESPSAGDTLYRYKINATKDNNIQIIDLPDYFVHLNKDVQIFVTGQGHFGNGYGNFNRDNEQLEIHCQSPGEYNILVIGTRNDDHQSVQDWDIKGVEREIGESWTGETYVFEVDEIMEVEEIKEGI